MKNKISAIYFILFVLLIPIRIYADTCSDEDMQLYKQMAENVRISYKIKENIVSNATYDQNNMFSITMTNIPKELKIFESKISYMFENTGNEEFTTITQENFTGGTNLRFVFYTTDKTNCPMQKIKIKNLQLPVYNAFYEDELCSGIEQFKYCNKTIENRITYEGFKKNVLKYRESLNDDSINNSNNSDNSNSILKQVKNFISKNLLVSLLSIVLIILTIIMIIYILKKKRGKSL